MTVEFGPLLKNSVKSFRAFVGSPQALFNALPFRHLRLVQIIKLLQPLLVLFVDTNLQPNPFVFILERIKTTLAQILNGSALRRRRTFDFEDLLDRRLLAGDPLFNDNTGIAGELGHELVPLILGQNVRPKALLEFLYYARQDLRPVALDFQAKLPVRLKLAIQVLDVLLA